MRVAYLVNQYPAVSHTFIRREIAALEEHGLCVARFTLRQPRGRLVDAADLAEQSRTRCVLDVGALGLGAALARDALRRPWRLARALVLTLRLAVGSGRGVLVHLVYLAEACVLAGWIERRGIRHLHAHFGTNSATVAMLSAALAGVSFSFTAHGPEEFDRAELIGLEQKIARAHFVAAVSSYGRSQLMRRCAPAAWGKLAVVRCGVDDGFLCDADRSPRPSPAARFVCVGRLCEQKGQLLLVEAAARLVASGRQFELVLVGDGEMRDEIERAIERAGLRSHVEITGWADGARVREELARARALVLPSLAEGLPVVIVEALALGRPVISTFVAGIPELVETGCCGWLVPAGSVDALVVAMAAALDASPDELERLGREGRSRVEKLHDARTAVEPLVERFRCALAESELRSAPAQAAG